MERTGGAPFGQATTWKGGVEITGTMKGSLNRSNGRFYCIASHSTGGKNGNWQGHSWDSMAQVPGKQSIVPCFSTSSGQAHTSQQIFKSTLFTLLLTERSEGD